MEKKRFLAGAATVEICFPPEMFPLPPSENFTGVHDNPLVHVLVWEREERYALAALDLCDLSDKQGLRRVLTDTLKIPEDRVIIHSTHTLSSPHCRRNEEADAPGLKERNDMMVERILHAAGQAAEKAKASLREARVGYGVGCTSISISRMAETADGWWQASNDAGATDPAMPVIRIEDVQGKVIALLYDVNCAPSTLQLCFTSGGGRLVSGDIASRTSRILEESYGEGAVAIYLTGAEADTWQIFRARHTVVDRAGKLLTRDLHEQGYFLVELLADRLAQQVWQAAEKIVCRPLSGPIRKLDQQFTVSGKKAQYSVKDGPAKEMEFYEGPDADLQVTLLRLGEDTAACCIGVEVTTAFAQEIRERSPFPNTFLVSFATDGYGYLVEEEWYQKSTYQCRMGGYAPGSAERFCDEIIRLLGELKQD